jgi:hypothetical protein
LIEGVWAEIKVGGEHLRLFAEHSAQGVQASVYNVKTKIWIAPSEAVDDIEQGKEKAAEYAKKYLKIAVDLEEFSLRLSLFASSQDVAYRERYPKNSESGSDYQQGGSMKTFQVEFRYEDRKNGSAVSTLKVNASNLPGAIAKATRQFVKALDRKQRFDMNKNGLEIKAVCIGAEKESTTPTDNSNAAVA